MKLWTRDESFPWPVAETDPLAQEVSGGMLDSSGKRHFVRYLGPTPPTVNDLDAQVNPTPEQLATLSRDAAKATFDSFTKEGRILKAILRLLLGQINTLRQWDMADKNAMAASSTFQEYKTRKAAMPDLADITAQQVRNAISQAIDAE